MAGLLLPALLCAALGLAAAFATKRTQWIGMVSLAGVACITALFHFPLDWKDKILVAGWGSLMVTALSVLIPTRLSAWLVLSLAVNAGFWTGALMAVTAQPRDLAFALPLVLVAFPARWALTTPMRLGVKVIAGWLIAVAILGAGVSMLPTPGYKRDHVE